MVNGVGHYTYGNNVSGATNPSGTSNVPTNSLYLDENNLPEFLAPQFLPMAGYPLGINDKLLAAEERFLFTPLTGLWSSSKQLPLHPKTYYFQIAAKCFLFGLKAKMGCMPLRLSTSPLVRIQSINSRL